MGKRKIRNKKNKYGELPRSGLNPVPAIMPDKGPAAWNSFNSMNGGGEVSFGACFESMEDEERSGVDIYIEWLNPYTNENDLQSVSLPNEILDNSIQQYLKLFDIEASAENFKKLLSDLDTDVKSIFIEDSEKFSDIAKEEYLKSEWYEKDKAQFLDDYEFLNDLGKYEEPDDYIES